MELQRDLVTTTLLDCVKSGLAGKTSMPLHMLARLRPSSEAGALICKWPFLDTCNVPGCNEAGRVWRVVLENGGGQCYRTSFGAFA